MTTQPAATASAPFPLRVLRAFVVGRHPALRSPRIVVGGGIVLCLALVAMFAGQLAPYSPTQMVGRPVLDPGGRFLLGTDDFGRDVFSRLIHGSRVSLGVSLGAVSLATVAGVVLGLLAGYYRGWVEQAIMRGADILLSFPAIILALAMVAILGNSIPNLILVIAIVYLPRFVRVVFGSVLSVREQEYVTAARAVGASDRRIIFAAILPNIVAPVLVQSSLSLGFAILVESGLAFLGLGATPPTPTWGGMISSARSFMDAKPLMVVWPAIAVATAILAFNTLGDGLRDLLDPRLRGAR